eukprot:2727058-Prymnesium_polylepis.1
MAAATAGVGCSRRVRGRVGLLRRATLTPAAHCAVHPHARSLRPIGSRPQHPAGAPVASARSRGASLAPPPPAVVPRQASAKRPLRAARAST